MPNGRPGDHPYTDIVVHDAAIYTEEIREYTERIDEYDEFGVVGRARSLLWGTPRDAADEEVVKLASELRALVQAIEKADEYPAASPLDAVIDGESLYTDRIRSLVCDIYEEMTAEINNTRRGHMKLSALLWKVGWEADDPEALEAELRDFRENHWVWEK